MKIIDGIFKNYTYKNEQHKSVVAILFLAANIESHLERILEPYNITMRQLRIMRQLRAIYPGCIPVSDLKECLIHRQADISRLVQRMLNTGWAEKRSCTEDKRVSYIKITDKGLDLLKELDKNDNEFLLPINVLDDDATKQLNEHLEIMLSTFQENHNGKIYKIQPSNSTPYNDTCAGTKSFFVRTIKWIEACWL